MSSSSGEKKHPPSERKLRKAREEGNVAQSRTLTASVATLAISIALGWWIPSAGLAFTERSRALLTQAWEPLSAPSLVGALRTFAWEGFLQVAPLMVAGAALAAVVAFLQVGPVVATKALAPRIDRLNPLTGLQQRCVGVKPMVEFLRGMVGIAVVGTVTGLIAWSAAPTILRLGVTNLHDAASSIADLCARLLRWGAAAMAMVGIADFAWQRYRHRKDQGMTDQELREELREDQGDPAIVAARKRRHQEIVRDSCLAETRRATFLARNPTHLACAVRYDPTEHAAPVVVAKGADLMALRMVDLARESGVEMIEDIPLARALYRAPVGRPVPVELLAAVQAVLEQVQERMLLRGECPPWLPAVLTPSEMERIESALAEIRSQAEAMPSDGSDDSAE